VLGAQAAPLLEVDDRRAVVDAVSALVGAPPPSKAAKPPTGYRYIMTTVRGLCMPHGPTMECWVKSKALKLDILISAAYHMYPRLRYCMTYGCAVCTGSDDFTENSFMAGAQAGRRQHSAAQSPPRARRHNSSSSGPGVAGVALVAKNSADKHPSIFILYRHGISEVCGTQ
jgi:hypothetical protein